MQSNASDVGCFCVEQSICSAGLEPGRRSGAGVGGCGTVPISPSQVLGVQRQVRGKPCFLGPGTLYSSHISFGGVKRVPSLILSSRTLSGARQFPMEDRGQLPLGSSCSQASD